MNCCDVLFGLVVGCWEVDDVYGEIVYLIDIIMCLDYENVFLEVCLLVGYWEIDLIIYWLVFVVFYFFGFI